MTLAPIDLGVIALYLLATLALGAWAGLRAKERTTREYVTAGRSLPAAAVGLSMLATLLNADDFVAEPALAFETDLSFFAYILGGLIATVVAGTV